MDKNRNKPDQTVIYTDIQKLTDVAKSAIDYALEVIKLLPTPISTDSKVYKSLEAIQSVPLESSSRRNTVGIQVNFISRGPETMIEEANISDGYEMISVSPDKQLTTEIPSELKITEAKEDVKKSDKVMEIEIKCLRDATIGSKPTDKFKYSEDFKMELKKFEDNVKILDKCAILLSKVKSEQEIDIEDKEIFSMKSCKSILKLLKLEECSETSDNTYLMSKDRGEMLNESFVVPNENENSIESLVPVTKVIPIVKTATVTDTEETMKHKEVKPQKSRDMKANEEKTLRNSTSNLNITSIKDTILDLVKPKNYKPELKERRIFVCDEELKKCLEIAEKAMDEHNNDKAKRMTNKAKRIHAKLQLQPIATEAAEKAESLQNLAQKNVDEAFELTTKSQKVAKISITEIPKEEVIQANDHSENVNNINAPDSDTCKVDESFDLINQAKVEIKQKNIKKAEQLLVQSINIHSTSAANKLLREIRKSESGSKPDNSIIDDDSLYQSQKCIKIARKYMNNNNYKKAEHFLKKSIHIAPSTKAQKMLEKVQGLLFEVETKQNNPFDRIEFEKYVERAWNAIAEENLIEAEKIVERAKDMQPTENEAKDMLVGLTDGLEDRKNEARARNDIELNEELLMTYVETAIAYGDYEIAEVLLKNAWIRHRSIRALQMLSGQVYTARNYGNKKNKDGGKLKALAEKYVEIIDTIWDDRLRLILTSEMAQNLLCVLIVAQNTYATLRGKELINMISNIDVMQICNKHQWNYEKKTKNKQSFKCNCYVEIAEIAYRTGNYDVAKQFLEEAVKLIPAKDIKHLIIQVENTMRSKCWPL